MLNKASIAAAWLVAVAILFSISVLGWSLVYATAETVVRNDASSLESARKTLAAIETVQFIEERLPQVESVESKQDLLRLSVNSVDPKLGGLWCEFGVYTGGTINFIASLVDKPVHGFDSFEGLPEDWRAGFGERTFAIDKLPVVRQNVVLHAGWFKDSLGPFLESHPGPIAFMHLDADLYSSTKTVFEFLGDRIVPGTVLLFDEYWNFPGWRKGEHLAFLEFVEENRVQFEYLGYTHGGDGQQVALRITAVARQADRESRGRRARGTAVRSKFPRGRRW